MNTEFVSVAELKENAPYGAQQAVKEELFAMKQDAKRSMDSGLSPDEMRVARALYDSIDAADVILDKLFA